MPLVTWRQSIENEVKKVTGKQKKQNFTITKGNIKVILQELEENH